MSVESEIEDILLYLSLARERSYSRARIARFDGAIPMFSDGVLEGLVPENESDFLPPEDMLPTSIGAWDVSIVSWLRDYDSTEPTRRPKFHLGHFRSVSPKEVRGKVASAAPYYVEQCAGYVYDDGEYWGAAAYLGWQGRCWRILPRFRDDHHATRVPEVISDRVRIAQSVAFTKRWWWLATLRLDDGPALSLPTDPVGVQELFRLRDLPAGGTRRAALLHWVAEHWRKRRNDPHTEGRVRAHLRGATDFTWNGLSVKIAPSKADADKNEELKALAAKTKPRTARARS